MDLDNDITCLKQVADPSSAGDPEPVLFLMELSNSLYDRIRQADPLICLEEAIALDREACPSGNHDRPSSLYNVVRCLLARWCCVGALSPWRSG